MRNGLIFCILSTILWVSHSFASGQNLVGQAVSKPCSTCHGIQGQSLNPAWPHLAGQEPNYLKKQIQDLKLGLTRKVDPQMRQFIDPLTDEDIENIASYYASKSKPTGSHRWRSASKLGESLYLSGNVQKNILPCITCHGAHGEGSGIRGFPSLKGQQIDYIVHQLKAFQVGERKNDLSQSMTRMTALMTEEEMIALAKYVASF